MWSEVEGNHGVVEIGSFLIQFATTKAEEEARRINTFYDKYPGQDRTRLITSTIVYIVANTEIEMVRICFLEKGHTD